MWRRLVAHHQDRPASTARATATPGRNRLTAAQPAPPRTPAASSGGRMQQAAQAAPASPVMLEGSRRRSRSAGVGTIVPFGEFHKRQWAAGAAGAGDQVVTAGRDGGAQ